MNAAAGGNPVRSPTQPTGNVTIQGASGVVFGDYATQNNYGHNPGRLRGAAYLEQVRDIAPSELHDRERELKELAEFCHGDKPYIWWQAGPWAGKSALMSWFVLNPPEDTDVACFFITGRLAAQADSVAFTEALLEQLASLVGEELPMSLALTARDAHRRLLLREAARRAHENGRRLALVIDGLDEDRSRRMYGAAGEGLPSIAALLPRHEVEGLRVIVSGRPNPQIPGDVPHDHPVRNCPVRYLPQSGFASDIERLAKEELRRLLNGSEAERSILGLVTAAQGGLTGSDLGELTGLDPHQVGELMSGVAGRTFTRRASQWRSGTGSEVYLLGHDELQVASTASLGAARLTALQGQLHEWAGNWREQGWPAGTPEYLLGGYFRLLEEQGDLIRISQCALDLARHDRMLDMTGGDATALMETRAALDRIAAQQDPDAATALALACHRDQLVRRSANIPVELVSAWITLGNLPRAQALAASISDSTRRAEALGKVATALAAAGQHEHATETAMQAETTARTITDSAVRADALAGVAEALAGTAEGLAGTAEAQAAERHLERVTAIARSVGSSLAKSSSGAGFRARARIAEAVARAVAALATAGQFDRAVAAARSIVEHHVRQEALVRIAEGQATTGQFAQAIAIARATSDPGSRTQALARVARALASAGQHQKAIETAREAEACARSITTTFTYSAKETQIQVVEALIATGQFERALAIAGEILDPSEQTRTLARVARALASAGQHQKAIETAREAEACARFITYKYEAGTALGQVAEALASAGEYEHANAVLRSIDESSYSTRKAYLQVAEALASAGQSERAAAIAQLFFPSHEQVQALARVSTALASAGQPEQAAETAGQAQVIALSIANPQQQAVSLARAAKALAAAGQHENAAKTAMQAETTVRSITPLNAGAETLAQIAGQLARAEQQKHTAETATRSTTGPILGIEVHVETAVALAEAGNQELAVRTLARAEAAARLITNPYLRAKALGQVAEAMAAAGQHQQGIAVALPITDPDLRASTLAHVAETLAAAGRGQQAAATASQAASAARLVTEPEARVSALVRVAQAMAKTARPEQAMAIIAHSLAAARSIPDPVRQAKGLVQIATAMTEAAHHEQAAAIAAQAEKVPWSVTDPTGHLEALAAVSEILTRAGYEQHASRLAVTACTRGPWTAAIKPVLLLAPSASTLVTAVLENSGKRQRN